MITRALRCLTPALVCCLLLVFTPVTGNAQDIFKAGASGVAAQLTLLNPYEHDLSEVQVTLNDKSTGISGVSVSPGAIRNLGAQKKKIVTISFDISDKFEEPTRGFIELMVVSETGGFDNPLPRFEFDIEPSERHANCNDAVKSGADKPETVVVDLGGFIGTAGFSWEMYNIKDQMLIYVGNTLVHDTGCVSHTGRKTLAVSGGEARVEVKPNCEDTSGTQWNFSFECPAAGADTTATNQPATPSASTATTAQPASTQSTSTQAAGSGPSTSIGPAATATTPALPPLAQSVPSANRTDASESEPNNATGNATVVTTDGVISGTINPRSDVDNFLISVPRHGEWRLTLVNVALNQGVKLGVFKSPNGGWLPQVEPGNNQSLVVDLPGPGDYILRVWSDNNTVGSYQIDTQFIPSPDLHEANNTVSTAGSIYADTPLTGAILPSGDSDHYLLDVPNQGVLTIDFADQPASLDVKVGVYRHPNGGWLADHATANDSSITVDLPAPGKYVVRVWSGSNLRSVQPYRLRPVFTPTTDSGEPNNTASAATVISPDVRIVSNILPKGDQDHYLVEVSQQGEWSISIEDQPAGLDLRLGVYAYPNGGWITDAAPADTNLLVVDLPAPGKYVVRAWSGNSARSVDAYSLSLSYTDSADQFEPNNTTSTAASINSDSVITATILPKSDSDNYILRLQPGLWEFSIVEQPPDMKLKVGLFKAPNGGWIADRAKTIPGKIEAEITEQADYIFRVWSGSSQRSVQPYKIAIKKL